MLIPNRGRSGQRPWRELYYKEPNKVSVGKRQSMEVSRSHGNGKW